MKRKALVLFVLLLITGAAYVALILFSNSYTAHVFQSALATTILYATFSIGVSEIFAQRLGEAKTRYNFRKAVSLFFIFVTSAVLLRIWIPDPQALLVAYGLAAAGVAVALQDLIKNFAGGVTILLGGTYKVGNRIEINGTEGDVIDIGLFSTTLLEIGGWIGADQATGRITSVPNGAIFSTPVQNYTKLHKYLWDELSVVVTTESDWGEAMRLMGAIGQEHTSEFVEKADSSLTKLERYYYVEGHVLKPNVYITPASDGYALALRYVVNAWKRRSTASDIWGHIIRTFEEHPAIEIAPTTYAVTEYPRAER